MKRKTFMSEELEAAGINVQYDAHAKRVLGSRQVLARILQGAAEEYRGYSAEEIGAWIEPDIHIEWPGAAGKRLCGPDDLYVGNAMSEYRITKTDVMGRIPELKSSYDKLSVVIICLDGRNAGDSKGSLHGFLGTLLSPDMSVDEKRGILEQDYGMKMEQELEEELRQMCNLSEAIEERGFSKGFSQGISEGIEDFAALTENLLKESRLGDLQRAVKDEAFRSQLFEEYNIKSR